VYDVVLVAFEGPDRYSFVGGLATRMIDLAEALVDRGYLVHQLFVGDPKLPAREERDEGRLVLERWSQWISSYHPRDVYDGEDGKWRDFSLTVPPHLADLVAASASEGRRSVLLFEDWQTANAAIATAAILTVRLPGAAAILWNANNTYGFGNIEFPLLRRAASITTVSRFMRAEMSAVDVDAAVLPNGIAERWLKPLSPTEARPLREAFGDRPTFVKVARFDQDKRWLWAIDAIAFMRDTGARPRLLMRGSRSPYGDIVGARIRARGLSIERVAPQLAVGLKKARIVFARLDRPDREDEPGFQAGGQSRRRRIRCHSLGDYRDLRFQPLDPVPVHEVAPRGLRGHQHRRGTPKRGRQDDRVAALALVARRHDRRPRGEAIEQDGDRAALHERHVRR